MTNEKPTECSEIDALEDVLAELKSAKTREAKFNALVRFKNTNFECGCGLDTFKRVDV